ncbi:hypothetical protein GOODEAATRI_006173, partial [Goodea atripinnis]
LSVWAALCVLVLGWFYVFPVYRLPSDKEIVEEVLGLGEVWQKNQTGIDLYRNLLTECCNPSWMFAVTKENSPIGKVLWYDGEFYHSHSVSNKTYSLFVQVMRAFCFSRDACLDHMWKYVCYYHYSFATALITDISVIGSRFM